MVLNILAWYPSTIEGAYGAFVPRHFPLCDPTSVPHFLYTT